MAMKVKSNENSNTGTEMTTVQNFLPSVGEGVSLVQVTNPDANLPVLKIVSPIEIDGTRIKPEHGYAFVISEGDSVSALPEGVILTVLAARDASRQLQVEIDGVKVACDDSNPKHKTATQKSYVRFYKALGSFNKTHDQFVNSLKEGFQTGISYLVGVVMPDGSCAVAELPAFKTAASYWHRALTQAILNPNKTGVKILISNHAVNVKSAKSDPTKKYCDPQKFNQWQIVDLSPDQITGIVGAVGDKKQMVDSWFQK